MHRKPPRVGVVDYVLSPDAIAQEIEAIAKNDKDKADEARNGVK